MGIGKYKELQSCIGKNYEIFSCYEKPVIHAGQNLFSSVAYKPQFAFLKQGLLNSIYIKKDVWTNSRLYYCKGKFFMTRQVDPDLMLQNDLKRINNLWALPFEHCRFEEVMGYFIDELNGGDDLLVHGFSGGLELFSISLNSPSRLRSKVGLTAVRAFAEIHKQGIIYYEPTPANMRWNYSSQIVFNPHPYMLFHENLETKDGTMRDLALFLMTNTWVQNQRRLLDEYRSKTGNSRIQKEITLENLIARIHAFEKNPDFPLTLYSFWRSR